MTNPEKLTKAELISRVKALEAEARSGAGRIAVGETKGGARHNPIQRTAGQGRADGGLSLCGKREVENGSFAHFAGRPHFSAVTLNDMFDD